MSEKEPRRRLTLIKAPSGGFSVWGGSDMEGWQSQLFAATTLDEAFRFMRNEIELVRIIPRTDHQQ